MSLSEITSRQTPTFQPLSTILILNLEGLPSIDTQSNVIKLSSALKKCEVLHIELSLDDLKHIPTGIAKVIDLLQKQNVQTVDMVISLYASFELANALAIAHPSKVSKVVAFNPFTSPSEQVFLSDQQRLRKELPGSLSMIKRNLSAYYDIDIQAFAEWNDKDIASLLNGTLSSRIETIADPTSLPVHIIESKDLEQSIEVSDFEDLDLNKTSTNRWIINDLDVWKILESALTFEQQIVKRNSLIKLLQSA